MESLDGILSDIRFHAVGKKDLGRGSGIPFLIGRLVSGVTIKGYMRSPRIGEHYRLTGEMRDQKGHPPAFCFDEHVVLVDDSVEGVVQYLKNYVPGLGIVKATAIVDVFGKDTLRVLRTNPEQATVVQGITEANVDAIRKHFAGRLEFDPVAYARLMDMFKNHKVTKKVVKQVLKDWGSDAPEAVLANPYMLLAYPRMGWKTVDAFATTTAGYPPKGVERNKAAIVEALEQISSNGHTCATQVDIDEAAFTLISGRPTEEAWRAALVERLITAEFVEDEMIQAVSRGLDLTDPDNVTDLGIVPITPGAVFMLPELAAAEREIADRLADLTAFNRALPCKLDREGLYEGQRQALDVIESGTPCLLVGPPGTGKSVTTSRFVKSLVRAGVRSIRIVAPTGKAAKREAELLAKAGIGTDLVPCTTIHRALGPVPSNAPEGVPSGSAKVNRGRDAYGFSHNAENPLECEVVIIAEASMVDVKLGACLLRAIAPGTIVLIVGDHNQLPSVGPGAFLRDCMAAGLPTAVLTEIVRSDGGGTVVRACHAIKDGQTPKPADKAALPTENWVHIELKEPADIAQKIVKLQRATKTFGDPTWDMQVISPQKDRTSIGCNDLNRMLSLKLNPPDTQERDGWPADSTTGSPAEESGFGPAFRVGDKVVRTKNGLCNELVEQQPGERANWTWRGKKWVTNETDIVNGDLGTVLDIVLDQDADETWVVVKFRTPDRLCRLPIGESHLIPAYALTVHKMQGSSARYIIVPVHESFYWDHKTNTGLWCRELFYTAVSRTEELLVTVGQFSAIRAAVSRRTIHQRKTRLAKLIRESFAGLDYLTDGQKTAILRREAEKKARMEDEEEYRNDWQNSSNYSQATGFGR